MAQMTKSEIINSLEHDIKSLSKAIDSAKSKNLFGLHWHGSFKTLYGAERILNSLKRELANETKEITYSHSTGYPTRRVYIAAGLLVAGEFAKKFGGQIMKYKDSKIVVII